MKKITVYDLFLIFAVILNLAEERNVYTAAILLCAGVMETVDIIPKIVRLIRDGSK